MAGAKPAIAMDNRGARPRAPRDSAASVAPAVETGKDKATAPVDATLANAVNVACAVNQVAPLWPTRSSRIDIEQATAAASSELAADGPPGTARKPAAAANPTAMMLNVTPKVGSGWTLCMA